MKAVCVDAAKAMEHVDFAITEFRVMKNLRLCMERPHRAIFKAYSPRRQTAPGDLRFDKLVCASPLALLLDVNLGLKTIMNLHRGVDSMKFGVQVSCYRTTWDDIRASIETLEAGRWNSLWFADHFLPPSPGVPGGARHQEQGTAFEGYTLIAVAAGMTKNLRLGHLVLGNTFRNPALLQWGVSSCLLRS